eukprot:CAMPEP_0114274758 /NCGR_PEP_ID=MMETSP0058-20121206/29956_1 /TAXON_ID=36894 /ORGANISM="Pyramimonas parkeae, CCMP726" /LENGTH=777 /DNA_ID=CAMNT_0001394611 /DNA_START=313 /DNA_END=2646 /DNA_ORIENTATION=-
MREQSAHRGLWNSLSFQNRSVTQHQAMTLIRKHPSIRELNLTGVPGLTARALDAALAQLPHLEGLTLGQVTIHEDLLKSCCERCPQLARLEIAEPVVPAGPAVDFKVLHHNLQELVLVCARLGRIFVNAQKLEKLAIRHVHAGLMLIVAPSLTDLDLSASKLTDNMLRNALASSPNLTALNLRECTYLSDGTLRQAAAQCPLLRAADLSYCPNLGMEGVHFPALTSLNLTGCDGVKSASVLSLNFCVALEDLSLDECTITQARVALPRCLRRFSCNGCRSLRSLTLHCPMLTHVSVQACSLLWSVEVHSSALASLSLRHLLELRSVSLQCPALLRVEISDCDRLADDVFAALSDVRACPALRSLSLDQCEGLTRGELRGASLRTLSLVGCKGLERLEAACESLREVWLNDCDRLAYVKLAPVGIEDQLDLGICPRLEELHLQAPSLVALKLCGCGMISTLELNCPSLVTLNTAFCARLAAGSLARAPAACPALRAVSLAYCASAVPPLLPELHRLQQLTRLDLSYTEVEDLGAVFQGCTNLVSLKIQACKYLHDDALMPLISGSQRPSLTDLDVSFCTLSCSTLQALLTRGLGLSSLNMSACINATDDLWPIGRGPREESADVLQLPGTSSGVRESGLKEATYALSTLSFVGCPSLYSLWLPATCAVYNNLHHLNLRLSSVVEINAEVASLQTLDLRECSSLTHLHLVTPKLSTLHIQACCALPASVIERSVQGAPSLGTLDIRDIPELPLTSIERIWSSCPALRRLLTNTSMCVED